MNHSGLLASGLVLVLAGCEVRVNFGDGEKLDRKKVYALLEDLQIQAGVEGTDERCPADVQPGGSYTCQVRTVIGEQLVELTVDRDATAHVKWQRPIVGGSVLASNAATLADGSRHAFDCAGKVLLTDDPTSVVVCAEVGRETAHIVLRGDSGTDIDYGYYYDVAGTIEKIVGGRVDRIDCPDAETIRGLAPFECKVWRDGSLLAVELTHAPEGWASSVEDRGPVTAIH